MYSELLLDHTALHTLRKRNVANEELPARAREVTQLVENLIFADAVWVCDTVTPQTMDWTSRVFGELEDCGLSGPRGDKLFRVTHITQSNLLEACRNAAPQVYDYVSDLGASDLRRSRTDRPYMVRPAGAQEMDFVSLTRLGFGTEKAADYVHSSISAKGWLPSSTIPLLDGDLFVWLKRLSNDARNKDDPAYIQFNTICRWKFNEQLAIQLHGEHPNVIYAPAYGRAVAIDEIHGDALTARLAKLQASLGEELSKLRTLSSEVRRYATPKEVGLPLFGIGVLQSLKEGCDIRDLVEQISNVRNDGRVRHIKKLLANGSSEEIRATCTEVALEINRAHPKGLGKSTAPNKLRSTLKLVAKLPFFPVQWEAQNNQDMPTSTWKEKKDWLRRKFTMSREATILTGLVEKALLREKRSIVLDRIRSLIAT
jgi:hypothetical protein